MKSVFKNLGKVPENFPKPIENMVLTTHDHLYFLILTYIIFFNFNFLLQLYLNMIKGKLKNFIMISFPGPKETNQFWNKLYFLNRG